MGTNKRFHGTNTLGSSSKQDSEVGLGRAIMKFMTQGCLGTRKIKRRNRPFHNPQETKHHQRLNQSYDKGVTQPVTLAEWMIQSPSVNGNFEGDPLMQVSKSVSRRVHPSLDRTLKGRQSKSGEGFTAKRTPVKLNEVKSGRIEDSFSFSTSRSGKFKKKVSFKEPEVADVFILKNSPE